MTVLEMLEQAKALSVAERKELTKLLIDSLDTPEEELQRQRHITELRGLGKDVWADIDPQAYVNQLRDECEQRP